MNKSSFLIVGQHAVIEALRNPKRKVLKVFLTEESKKNIHRKNPKKNVLEDVKVYFKSKKELDKYTSKDQMMHGGYIAEVEHLENIELKTMQSKIVTDLYFAGEVLDIDGLTGGYNFQSAWSTGFIAGKLAGKFY